MDSKIILSAQELEQLMMRAVRSALNTIPCSAESISGVIGEILPSRGGTIPAGGEAIPAGGEVIPVGGEVIPTGGETIPGIIAEVIPAGGEVIPVVIAEAIPVGGESIPGIIAEAIPVATSESIPGIIAEAIPAATSEGIPADIASVIGQIDEISGDDVGRKRKTSESKGVPPKKRPVLEVQPYNTFNDVDWSDEVSVERYISNTYPILTSSNQEVFIEEAVSFPPNHDSIFVTPRSPTPINDSVFVAPRTPTPVAPTSVLDYTLPPTNYVTPDNSFDENYPNHSTPINTESVLDYTIPATNYQSPGRSEEIDDSLSSLLSSISDTFEDEDEELARDVEDEELGRDVEDEEQSRDVEDEELGRDGEDEEPGRDGGEDVQRDGGEDVEDNSEESYEEVFKKIVDSSKIIPDHEALRLIIKNQTVLREEDRIPASKFSPFMLEFTTNQLTLQRSTMNAVQSILKSHQEISNGLLMSQFSKFTGLSFLDSAERKKKNWLALGIRNFTQRVIGKNFK